MKYKRWTLEQKLEILSKSEDIGVVETCREYGVSTAAFYNWKKKFEAKGYSKAMIILITWWLEVITAVSLSLKQCVGTWV